MAEAARGIPELFHSLGRHQTVPSGRHLLQRLRFADPASAPKVWRARH